MEPTELKNCVQRKHLRDELSKADVMLSSAVLLFDYPRVGLSPGVASFSPKENPSV